MFGALSNKYYAAMNNPMWDSSGNCGRCAELHYGNNCVQVMVVDECPECKDGDLDLS